MAYSIISPANSFIQFSESDEFTSCNFADINLCLPVYQADDVYFQFVIQADTIEEADLLCDLTNSLVNIGISQNCTGFDLEFIAVPDRYRISDFQVLYNWPNGLPGFQTVVNIGDCFMILVEIDGTFFCSNCLQRISETCHTTVIEYGNDDNFAGFNYCNSEGVDSGGDAGDCDPMFVIIPTNATTLVIPYTASMQAKYGNAPTIKGWLYDTTGELVNMSFRQAFDTYPPTELRFDFGGPANGIIKIS